MVDLSHDLSMMSVDGALQAGEDDAGSVNRAIERSENNEANRGDGSENDGNENDRNENSPIQIESDPSEQSHSESEKEEASGVVSDEEEVSKEVSDEEDAPFSDEENWMTGNEDGHEVSNEEARSGSDENRLNDRLSSSNFLSSDDSDLDDMVNNFNMSVRIDNDANRSQRSNRMDDSSIIILD